MNTELAQKVLDEEIIHFEKRLRSLEGKARKCGGTLEEKLALMRHLNATRALRKLLKKKYFDLLKELEAV